MKQDLLVNIIGGIVAAVISGIIMWQLEPIKDWLQGQKGPATIAASSPVSAKASTRASPDISASSDSASSARSSSQTGKAHYVNDAVLSDRKPITPVAVKGNADASRDVLDALAIPLKQGVFTRAFFNDGIFERALNGEGSGIAQLKLPKEINKIVLLQVGESQKTSIPDAQGAIKLRRPVAITVMETQSGAVIKAAKFVAEGVGFDEEFVERSLKEDLAAKLEPIRRAL
jgi:hypothetical protein